MARQISAVILAGGAGKRMGGALARHTKMYVTY